MKTDDFSVKQTKNLFPLLKVFWDFLKSQMLKKL